MSTEVERQLYVTWRRPDRRIVPVGLLTQRPAEDGTRFHFVYLKNAELEEDFRALPGLPDRHRSYEAGELFPVFHNRVMPRERPDYEAFIEQLDLDVEAEPFEVLARSEGVRETDRIEVFPTPERNTDGALTTLFFARGIRHLDGASAAVDDLRAGDELSLVPEPTNAVNARAMLLSATTGEHVGYAPDYLLDVIHEVENLNRRSPTVVVAHVNPATTPSHLRLLCRLIAPWPAGYGPFSGPEFQPLAS